MSNSSLTIAEQAELNRLEAIIDKGKHTFVEVGSALAEIRERRFYRRDYQTFEVYCLKKWGWHQRQANNYIQAAAVVQELPKDLGNALPNQRAAIEVAKSPKENWPAIVAEAKKNGLVTGPAIKEAAAVVAAPAVPLDYTGTKIPEPALPFWERRDEVQPWLTQLSKMKTGLEEAMAKEDSLYTAVTNAALSYIAQSYSALSNAKMYAVCTVCQGWWDKMASGGCGTCHNTGLVSKYHYDHCSRAEIKEIREKANALRK